MLLVKQSVLRYSKSFLNVTVRLLVCNRLRGVQIITVKLLIVCSSLD